MKIFLLNMRNISFIFIISIIIINFIIIIMISMVDKSIDYRPWKIVD